MKVRHAKLRQSDAVQIEAEQASRHDGIEENFQAAIKFVISNYKNSSGAAAALSPVISRQTTYRILSGEDAGRISYSTKVAFVAAVEALKPNPVEQFLLGAFDTSQFRRFEGIYATITPSTLIGSKVLTGRLILANHDDKHGRFEYDVFRDGKKIRRSTGFAALSGANLYLFGKQNDDSMSITLSPADSLEETVSVGIQVGFDSSVGNIIAQKIAILKTTLDGFNESAEKMSAMIDKIFVDDVSINSKSGFLLA